MKFSDFNRQEEDYTKLNRDFIILEHIGRDVENGILEAAEDDMEDDEEGGEDLSSDDTAFSKRSSAESKKDEKEKEGQAPGGLRGWDELNSVIVKVPQSQSSVKFPSMLKKQGYNSQIKVGTALQSKIRKGASLDTPDSAADVSKTYPLDHIKALSRLPPVFLDSSVMNGPRDESFFAQFPDLKFLVDDPELKRYLKPTGWSLATPLPLQKLGLDKKVWKAIQDNMDPEQLKTLISKPGFYNNLKTMAETGAKPIPGVLDRTSKGMGGLSRIIRMDLDDFIKVYPDKTVNLLPVKLSRGKKILEQYLVISKSGFDDHFASYAPDRSQAPKYKLAKAMEQKVARVDIPWTPKIIELTHIAGAYGDMTASYKNLAKRFLEIWKEWKKIIVDMETATGPELETLKDRFIKIRNTFSRGSYTGFKNDPVRKDMENVISILKKLNDHIDLGYIDTIVDDLKNRVGFQTFTKIARTASGMAKFAEDVLRPKLGNNFYPIYGDDLASIKKDIKKIYGIDPKASKEATFDVIFSDVKQDIIVDGIDQVSKHPGEEGYRIDNDLKEGISTVIVKGEPVGKFITASLKLSASESDIGKITSAFSDVMEKSTDIIRKISGKEGEEESVTESFFYGDQIELPDYDTVMMYEELLMTTQLDEVSFSDVKEKVKKGVQYVKSLGKEVYEKIRAAVTKIRSWRDSLISAFKGKIEAEAEKGMTTFLNLMMSEGSDLTEAVDETEDTPKSEETNSGKMAEKISKDVKSMSPQEKEKFWKYGQDLVKGQQDKYLKGIDSDKVTIVLDQDIKTGKNLTSLVILKLAGNYATPKLIDFVISKTKAFEDFVDFTTGIKTGATFGASGGLPLYRVYGTVGKGLPYQYLSAAKDYKDTTTEKLKGMQAAKEHAKKDNENPMVDNPSVIFTARPIEKIEKKPNKLSQQAKKDNEDTHGFIGYWGQVLMVADSVGLNKDNEIEGRYTRYRIDQQKSGNIFVEAESEGLPFGMIVNKYLTFKDSEE